MLKMDRQLMGWKFIIELGHVGSAVKFCLVAKVLCPPLCLVARGTIRQLGHLETRAHPIIKTVSNNARCH